MSRRGDILSDVLRSPSMELDEMIPVDNFFNDYMSRLQTTHIDEERKNLRDTQASFPETSNMLEPYPPVAPFHRDFATSQSAFGPASNQRFSEFPDALSRTDPQDNLAQDSGYYAANMSEGVNPMYGNPTDIDYGMNLESSQPVSATPPFLDGTYTESIPAGSGHVGSRISGITKFKPKTYRQQQLNKQAQQRYRERKKAKAADLEQRVNALSEQLAQLATVREEKLSLEEKNLNLERKLLEKEAELQAVKAQLEESKKAPGPNSSSEVTAFHQEEKPRPVGTNSKAALLFHAKVDELKRYLLHNKLDESLLVNPLDDRVSKEHVDSIHKLVSDVCMVCMQLSRQDGPDLWDLISASLDSKKRESHDRARWRSIAKNLRLNNDQVLTACRLREQHLMKLETIYIQRQNLNLEAIKLLLPQDHGGRGPAPQTLGCFNLATFIQRIRHTSKVSNCLDKLKENLSNEQKLNSEVEYMTFYRVMSPLQGAWFTVSAYPHQCDCLAFLNAVYELYGSQSLHNQESGSN